MDARKRVRRNHGSGGVAASTGGKGGRAWICDVAGMRILVATGQSRVIVIVIVIVFVLRFVLQEQIRGHRIIEGLVTKAGDITWNRNRKRNRKGTRRREGWDKVGAREDWEKGNGGQRVLVCGTLHLHECSCHYIGSCGRGGVISRRSLEWPPPFPLSLSLFRPVPLFFGGTSNLN